MAADGPDLPTPRRPAAERPWWVLARLALAICVAFLFGDRLSGGPLVAWLALAAFLPQLAALAESLSEWVEVKLGDASVRRVRERLHEELEQGEMATGQDSATSLRHAGTDEEKADVGARS